MTNDVVEKKSAFGGKVGMVNAASLAGALAESAAKDPRGAAADGMDYMNFSGKGGRYGIGVDQTDIAPDEAWLVNVGAFQDGWVCWKENRPVATRLYSLGEPVPQPNFDEHGPFTRDGDGWYQAKAMVVRSLDSGQQGYFKINSVSGVSVFASLQKDVVARIRAGLPAWPVVAFDKEKFTAKGYTNYKPIIKVLGWLDDSRVEQLAEVFDDEEAQIDLDELFLAAATSSPSGGETKAVTNGPTAEEAEVVEPKEEAQPAVARRNRRAAL